MELGTAKAISLAAAAIAATLCRPAAAQDVHCPPHLGAVAIDGDVLIAAPCELNGTEIDGDVRLFAGGSLRARAVEIDGDLRADTAFEVEIVDSVVDGHVHLDELVGDESVIARTEVARDIRLRDNRSFVQLLDNDVGSHVDVIGNRGGVDISGNRVRGHLRCRRNDPAPTGGNNTVRGRTEDQCARLVPRSAPDDSGDDDADGGEAPPPEPTPAEPPAPPAEDTGGAPPADPAGGPFNPVNEYAEGGGGGGVELASLVLLALLLAVSRATAVRDPVTAPRPASARAPARRCRARTGPRPRR